MELLVLRLLNDLKRRHFGTVNVPFDNWRKRSESKSKRFSSSGVRNR